MFLPPNRLLRKGSYIIFVSTILMLITVCIIRTTRRNDLDLDHSLRPLPSRRNEQSLTHRHLFHIYDIHSSLLERFKVVDLISIRKLNKWEELYNFSCTISKSVPSFKICLYEPEKDKFISAGLLSNGLWEPHITRAFQVALSRFPDATVIDVGANIGYYSLLASAMGHNVVAIEPQEENIKRFVAGACADHWNDNIILLANALSDSHRRVGVSSNLDNQGGVRVLDSCELSNWIFRRTGLDTDLKVANCSVPTLTFDDLLYVVTTRSAVIKIDIEGYECRALATASDFFSAIKVPYVFMEWRQMRERQHLAGAACRPEQIRTLSNFFTDRGYVAHEIRSGIKLNPYSAENWRIGDIYWRSSEQDLLVPSL